MLNKQAFFNFKNTFMMSICQDDKLVKGWGYYCNLGDGHALHALLMA